LLCTSTPTVHPPWVAGSTHEGEEAIVLDAHRRVQAQCPDALLILVPRHPQRFETVRDLLAKRHEAAAFRSKGDAVRPGTDGLPGGRWQDAPRHCRGRVPERVGRRRPERRLATRADLT
jgi:hypothetical protein